MKKGFTLIELLIVIAVLGILAAGLLATVDPLEQMKKARDSNTRNTSVELYNAIIRYNSNKGYMPWDPTSAIANCIDASTELPIAALSAAQPQACMVGLISEGELKGSFSEAVRPLNNKIWLVGGSENVSVCFRPESRAVRQDSATRFSNDLTSTGCAWASVTDCYWCAQ